MPRIDTQRCFDRFSREELVQSRGLHPCSNPMILVFAVTPPMAFGRESGNRVSAKRSQRVGNRHFTLPYEIERVGRRRAVRWLGKANWERMSRVFVRERRGRGKCQRSRRGDSCDCFSTSHGIRPHPYSAASALGTPCYSVPEAPRDIAHTPVTRRHGSIQSCLGHTTKTTSPAAVISSCRMDK